MKTRKLFIFALLILIIGSSGCITDTIEGNGVQTTEERSTQSFHKVKSSGSFDVYITKGDDYEVMVSAEENVIPFIENKYS